MMRLPTAHRDQRVRSSSFGWVGAVLSLAVLLLVPPAVFGARALWARVAGHHRKRSSSVARRRALDAAVGAGCPLAAPVPEIAVFYHLYQADSEDNWRPIFEDSLRVLLSSSMMRRGGCGASLHMSSPQGFNSSSWQEHFKRLRASGVRVVDEWNGQPFPPALATPDVGERPTLAKLHEFCTAHPSALALYLHDKGVRHGVGDTNMYVKQLDWRRLHEHYLVEVWEDCATHLLKEGFWFCGAELRRWHTDGSLFYNGNFWWAKCSIVADIIHPMDLSIKTHHGHHPERYWSELWLLQAAVRKLGMRSHNASERAYNCAPLIGDHYYIRAPRGLVYEGQRCLRNYDEDGRV